MGEYVSVSEVAALLGQTVGRFNEDSLPAKDVVERIIGMVEEYIDNYVSTSWRVRKRWEDHDAGPEGFEYHKFRTRSWSLYTMLGVQVTLARRKVLPFDRSQGDSLQVFNGNEFEEWLGNRVEGTNGDFWVNYDDGILYIRRFFVFGREGYVVRVKYRYGGGKVPPDVRYAAALLTACHLIESGDYTVLLPEGASNIVNAVNKVSLWRERAMEILDRYKEVMVID